MSARLMAVPAMFKFCYGFCAIFIASVIYCVEEVHERAL
jgi:hypothetical protein